MSKVLLVIDMSDEDYQLLEKYTKQKMIVDIGFNHDNMFGWTFMRRKVLCAKPMPERINPLKVDSSNLLDLGYMHGRNDLINEMEGEVEE